MNTLPTGCGATRHALAERDARQDGAMPRPVMRYHGGKYRLAPWILAHLPPCQVRVEPFCGSARAHHG